MAAAEKSLMGDRMDWLLKQAELRGERDIQLVARQIQQELQKRSAQTEIERQESGWKEWWQARQEERSEKLHLHNFGPAAKRHEQVQCKQAALRSIADAEAARKLHEDAERTLALEHKKADDQECRRVKSVERDNHMSETLARAHRQQVERIEDELRQQNRIAQMRAEVEAVLARERARRLEEKQVRDAAAEARIMAVEQQRLQERDQMEYNYNAKIADINGKESQRDNMVSEMMRIRQETVHKCDDLRAMARQAAMTGKEGALRKELDALMNGRPSSSTSSSTPRAKTPRSPRPPPRAPSVERAPASRSKAIAAGAWRPRSASASRPALPASLPIRTNAPGQLASALRGFMPPRPAGVALEDNGQALPQVVTFEDNGKAWSDGQSTCVPGSDIFFQDRRSCASSNPDVTAALSP